MARALVALGLILLAACGGSSSGAPAAPTPTATPVANCSLSPGVQLAVVYPANGATGVSTNTTGVVVGASATPPALIQLELIDQNNNVQVGATLIAAAPPAGYAAPFSPASYWESLGFSLVGGDKYTVYFVNGQQQGCAAAPLGASFST